MDELHSNTIQDSTLILLMGEVDYSLQQFTTIVTWCPVRHHQLIQKGIPNYLFGDFSPGEKEGRALDKGMYEQLNSCLFAESKNDTRLKWAPLAVENIKWRLSRYQWLKQCMRAMIIQFQPARIIVSSQEDMDIIYALHVIVLEFDVSIELRHGSYDQLSIFFASYCIPQKFDPAWFHYIRWNVLVFLHKIPKIFVENCSNLSLVLSSQNIYPFNLNRLVGLFRASIKKIGRILNISFINSIWDQSRSLDINVPMLLNHDLWVSFSSDEQLVINAMLTRFFRHSKKEMIDICVERLTALFLVSKPSRIVLSHDQHDEDRLITYIAHQHNIQVDYLPHGIITEDYSGIYHNSPFQPDRILAWNTDSQKAFTNLSWNSISVCHPVNQQKIIPLRRLPIDMRTWKVLLFPIFTWPTIQSNREDRWITTMISIYNTLIEIGLHGKQIYVKDRISIGSNFNEINNNIFVKLRKNLGMQFQIVDPVLTPSNLFKNYDLVILGHTTAIIEAILSGIPLVMFDAGVDHIGMLRNFSLPHASSPDQLKKILNEYNYDEVSKKYEQLAYSLQSGSSIY